MTDPIVLDTNVLVSGLRSRNGQSFKLLERVLAADVKLAISTPLILEYEATLKKVLVPAILSLNEVDDLLDYICSIGVQARIFYLWRPYLKDPYDDHILELAVAAGSKYIVTYNRKDFQGAERFGIDVVEPRKILELIGGPE
jgi:putative PIN family toxin of toxin-antitoxin system